jgi:hypothetical protein
VQQDDGRTGSIVDDVESATRDVDHLDHPDILRQRVERPEFRWHRSRWAMIRW